MRESEGKTGSVSGVFPDSSARSQENFIKKPGAFELLIKHTDPEFVLYLITKTPFPPLIYNIVIIIISCQSILISSVALLLNYQNYQSPFIHFIKIAQYVFMVFPIINVSSMVRLHVLIGIYIIDIFFSKLLQNKINTKHYAKKWLCYVYMVYTSVVRVILPPAFGFTFGLVINDSIHGQLLFILAGVYALLFLILYSLSCFQFIQNHNFIALSNFAIFQLQNAEMFIGYFVYNFFMSVFNVIDNNDAVFTKYIRPGASVFFLLTFTYLAFNKKIFEKYCFLKFTFSSLIVCFSFSLCAFFIPKSEYIEIASMLVFALGAVAYIFFEIYIYFYRNKIMNAINDQNYASKVKSARQAAFEIGVAACYGHKEIIECTHDLALIARFPHDFFLNYQLILSGISLYSSPIQIDNLMLEVYPDIGIPKMHTFLRELLLRIRGPSSANEIEMYNKLVYELNESFSEFFTQFRIIADVIFDEFTSSISTNAIKAGKALQRASNDLLQFVQLYPNSTHAALFSKTMSKIIPPGDFLNEVSMWCSYRFPFPLEFLKNSPSTVKQREEGIPILKEYCPRYPPISQSLKETADHILNSAPDCPPIISNNIGPFQTTLKQWYVILALVILICVPLSFYILFISEMDYTNDISKDISRMYEIEMQIIFLDSYSSLFRMTWEHNNSFLTDLFNNVTSKQKITELCQVIQNVISVNSKTLTTEYTQKRFLDFLFTRSNYSDGFEQVNYRRLFTYINAAIEESIIDDVPIHTYQPLVFGKMMFRGISEALIKEINEWKYHGQNTSKWNDLLFSIICTIINLICGVVIILEFLNGEKRLNLFIDSLRATIKTSTRKVSNLFRQFAEIFPRHSKDSVSSIEKKDKGNNIVTITIVAVILYCIAVSAIEISMTIINKCFAQKLEHRANAFREFSIFNLRLAKTAIYSISVFFSKANESESIEEVFSIIESIHDPGNIMGSYKICPTCSLVNILDQNIVHNNISANKIIYPWLSWVSTALRALVRNDEDLFNGMKYNVSSTYYFHVLPVMASVIDDLNKTTIMGVQGLISLESVLFIIIIIAFFALVFTIYIMNMKGDEVYETVMFIMAHFKRTDLAQQTLDIVEHNEYATINSDYNLSNDSYDKLVMAMPSAAVVIDFSLTIFTVNSASAYLFKDPSIVEGSKFFESLKLDLIDIDRGAKLRTIIDQYVYGDCDMIEEHTVMHEGKYVYKLAILPLFPSDTSDKISRKLALLFNDISESVRQQKLLEQQSSRPIEIMNDWLPTEISEQFVEKHATPFFTVNSGIIIVVKVCGLVKKFDRKHPDTNISTIEQIFKMFDSVVVNYKMITKLRTHSDTCVLGSGIFFHGLNRIHALETLKCCFELISYSKSLNQTISSDIQLKIGAALGGPFVAGVLGPQHPWFDAWGETVDDAFRLADTAQEGSVNMNAGLHDVAKELHVNFVGSEQGDAYMVKPR